MVQLRESQVSKWEGRRMEGSKKTITLLIGIFSKLPRAMTYKYQISMESEVKYTGITRQKLQLVQCHRHLINALNKTFLLSLGNPSFGWGPCRESWDSHGKNRHVPTHRHSRARCQEDAAITEEGSPASQRKELLSKALTNALHCAKTEEEEGWSFTIGKNGSGKPLLRRMLTVNRSHRLIGKQ